MNKLPIPIVLALVLATSLGFACGYAFYSNFGEARSAAAQAILDAQSTQRVLQAYEPIVVTWVFHKELMSIETMQDARDLQQKYRGAALRNIAFFEHQAKDLKLPKERALAAPFLESAERTRQELGESRPSAIGQ